MAGFVKRLRAPPPRKVVLVLGAPRSGTSMTAHVLSALGFYFGEQEDFVSPEQHGHNPIFFELQALNDLNDQIIRALGGVYGHFDFLVDDSSFTPAFRAQWVPVCQAFIRDYFKSAPNIGLKDPRFCFTLPVWIDALKGLDLKVIPILTRRTLLAMASSNSARNQRSIDFSRRLVCQSILSARYFLRNIPHKIFDYDLALRFSLTNVKTLARTVGAKRGAVEGAVKVVDQGLRHFGDESARGDALSPADNFLAYWPYTVDVEFHVAYRDLFGSILSDMNSSTNQVQESTGVIAKLSDLISRKDRHIAKLEIIFAQNGADMIKIRAELRDKDAMIEMNRTIFEKMRNLLHSVTA